MNKLILFIICFILCACTNEKEARRVLDLDGFVDVEMTGYKFMACGHDDWYHTGFRAKRNFKVVDGVVCTGLLFKASTIRF